MKDFCGIIRDFAYFCRCLRNFADVCKILRYFCGFFAEFCGIYFADGWRSLARTSRHFGTLPGVIQRASEALDWPRARLVSSAAPHPHADLPPILIWPSKALPEIRAPMLWAAFEEPSWEMRGGLRRAAEVSGQQGIRLTRMTLAEVFGEWESSWSFQEAQNSFRLLSDWGLADWGLVIPKKSAKSRKIPSNLLSTKPRWAKPRSLNFRLSEDLQLAGRPQRCGSQPQDPQGTSRRPQGPMLGPLRVAGFGACSLCSGQPRGANGFTFGDSSEQLYDLALPRALL